MLDSFQFKTILRDRAYFVALALLVSLAIIIVISSLFYVQPSDLQVPVRYSRFSAKLYDLGRWYYLINFVVIALLVCASHILLSAKLYHLKGRVFAIGMAYVGVGVLAVALVYVLSLFKVVSLLQ